MALNRMTTTITVNWIAAGESGQGGWNQDQLAIIGVPWPPRKGWKDRAVGIAEDAREWTFFVYANYEGSVVIRIKDLCDIENAVPIIRQSLKLANS